MNVFHRGMGFLQGRLRAPGAVAGGGYTFPEFEAALRLPALLRLVMVAVAVVAILGATASHWLADSRFGMLQGSQEALNLAGRQRMLSQRLAQLGLQWSMGSTGRDTLLPQLEAALLQLREGRTRLGQLPFFAAHAASFPSAGPLAEAVDALIHLQSPNSAVQASTAAARVADDYLLAVDVAVGAMQQRAESLAAGAAAAQRHRMIALATLVALFALASGQWLARRLERQNTRARQLASELERLALVAERTENGVVITDLHGQVEWANEAFSRISGYPLVEMLGQRPGSLLQFEGTDPAARQQIRDALAARRPVQVDILNRSKTGRTYWLHLDIQPIRDAEGRCTGFSAVETDITAQVLERERLASVLKVLPAGVVQQDVTGRITDANPEACQILGLRRDQMLGLESVDPRWHTVYPDGSPFPGDLHPAMLALREGSPQRGVMMGVALPSGERRWIRVNAEPLRSSVGTLEGVVSSFVDITEASSQRRLLSLTVQAAGLGTWDWWMPSGEVKFNERWWQMLGYEPGALPAAVTVWESLVHPDDVAAARAALQRHLADHGQPYHCEFRMRRADGSWGWIMAAGAVIERQANGRPQRMAGIHLDIGARKALEERLADAALTDTLTGLPNRAALRTRLVQCAARAQRDPAYCFAVLFMDFDRFKQVNDSFGHDAGDELLRQIAQRLRATLRPSDDLARLEVGEHTAVRLGGDEFVALLEPLRRPEDALLVAQRLLDALAAPYQLAGQEVTSTVSIGVVTSQSHRGDPEELLRDADTAMYEAKRRGRGRYVEFSRDMHERVRQAMDLEADLRRALRADGEVFPVYQPIVDMSTGRLCGVEALARWMHPTRGAVPPIEFIPLAEDSGLIAELGELMLRVVCVEASKWREEFGADDRFTVSVNISRAQLRKHDLPDVVERVLAETGLDARVLRLELTESVAMQDAQIVPTLNRLRALGVSLALDDFGTGYSSLATLDQLPLDAVKIDRSFVERMVENRYQAALIKATLDVAGALGLDVVAEGVETEEQANMLRLAGCRLAQGWLFGRPEGAARIAERFRKSVDEATGDVRPRRA